MCFWVLHICSSGENYFFGNYMKYRSDRSKKNIFRYHFFRSFFKLSTLILAKLGHCSSFFWHFEGAMHALWLLMTPRKFWKKNENVQNLWNFGVFFNLIFFSRLIWIKELDYDWILLHAQMFVWNWF